MKLNILVPNYNNGEFLDQCLKSIVEQKTDFEFHILINDDCSTDNSIEIINKYILQYPNNITLFKNSINLNLLPTIFKLYQNINSDYFTVLDSDDYWMDDKFLQRAVTFLDNNEKYSKYSEMCQLYDNKLKKYTSISSGYTGTTVFRGRFDDNIIKKIKNIIDLINKDDLIITMRSQLYQGDSFRNFYFDKFGSTYINKNNIASAYRVNTGMISQWSILDSKWQLILNTCFMIEMGTIDKNIKPVLKYTLTPGKMLFYKNNYYTQEEIDKALDYFNKC